MQRALPLQTCSLARGKQMLAQLRLPSRGCHPLVAPAASAVGAVAYSGSSSGVARAWVPGSKLSHVSSSRGRARLPISHALPPLHYLPPLAMVNVDFSNPSLVLGIGLIGCGVVLLQLRNMQTRISRDADIVVAAMVSIVGGTLIFQGWRLDPLLLLCQALTTSVAVWYGVEAFQLRSKEEDFEDEATFLPAPQQDGAPQQQQQQQQQQQSFNQSYPDQQQPSGLAQPWASSSGQQYDAGYNWQAQQPQQQAQAQWQPMQAQPTGTYLPPGQEAVGYPWGQQGTAWGAQAPQQQQQEQQWDDSAYAEATIRYDYYGNPVQEAVSASVPYEEAANDYGGASYGSYPSSSAQQYEGDQGYPYSEPAYSGSPDGPGSRAPTASGAPYVSSAPGGSSIQPSGGLRAASGKSLPSVLEPVDDWE